MSAPENQPARNSPPTPPSDAPGGNMPLRHIILSTLIDAGGAYLVYTLLAPHLGQKPAILLSAVPSLLSNIASYARRRTLDYIGVIVIAGTLAGLCIYFLGGSPRMLLARDSVVTGVIGLVFLASLFLHRPLVFYLARQMTTGDNPQKLARWDAVYAVSPSRMGMPLMTLVWGLGLVLEAAVHVALAFTLPIPIFVLIGHVISIAVYFGLMTWSFAYGRVLRSREVMDSVAAPPLR